MSTFGQTVLIESAQILLNFCSEYFCNFINIDRKKENRSTQQDWTRFFLPVQTDLRQRN